MSADPPPQFVLLTGALGSGKTTLLCDHLAVRGTADTGVIVNDAGEIAVDGAIVGADNRDLALATLGDGCICCSLGNGVQEGIDALLLARAERGLGPLRRIILEASGLAEPGPILRALRQGRQADFALRIVTTFDAAAPACGAAFLPAYAAQLAAAQVVVLTKLDAAPRARPGKVREAKRFNPLATLVATPDRAARAHAAFEGESAGPPALPAAFMAAEAGGGRIRTALARFEDSAGWEEIGDWIEDVSAYFGPRLLRMKGLVRPRGFSGAVLVNGVGGVFSPPRRIAAGEEGALGLTMILRDVAPSEFSAAAPPGPALRFA